MKDDKRTGGLISLKDVLDLAVAQMPQVALRIEQERASDERAQEMMYSEYSQNAHVQPMPQDLRQFE